MNVFGSFVLAAVLQARPLAEVAPAVDVEQAIVCQGAGVWVESAAGRACRSTSDTDTPVAVKTSLPLATLTGLVGPTFGGVRYTAGGGGVAAGADDDPVTSAPAAATAKSVQATLARVRGTATTRALGSLTSLGPDAQEPAMHEAAL